MSEATVRVMGDLDGQPRFRPSERHLLVYWVPEYLIAAAVWDIGRIMLADRSSDTSLCLPQIADVPDGAVLEQVRHSWERKCFGFLFSHPSFAVRSDGQELPGRSAVLAYRTVALPAGTRLWNDLEDLH